MKRNIIFLFIVASIMLVSCRNADEDHMGPADTAYYTCPMHPYVKSNTPGSCQVCNMPLVKVAKKESSHEEHKGNFITLDSRQQLLAGIETDTVRSGIIIPASTILGTIAIDEEQVVTVSSRVKGRIDRLYIKSSGEYIRKGNPIYGIYSEELLSDEKEFLVLKSKGRGKNDEFLDNVITASKNKLLLWGLSENQISEIEKNKVPSTQITFYSQVEGYVTEVPVKEGMYVDKGTPLIKLADLKRVWVKAQVYTNEEADGDNFFQVFSATSPDEVYNGSLAFNNPSVEEGRKVQLLRIRVDNPKNRLIPGMMVYVSHQKTAHPVLSIQKSAVLLEKMKTVWIKKDETTFEQRMVETGTENKYLVEILSGIKEGEIIVTRGAYLINSEFVLKQGAGQRHEH